MLIDNIEIEIIYDFYSEILDNFRNIRVYLPPSYSLEDDKHYPVLYIQDGQNIFDPKESYSGRAWDLHKTADYMIKEKLIEEIIIIAVDHMEEERLNEYAHQDGFYKDKKIKARGAEYEEFFVKELMPFIEDRYRLKDGAQNRAIMGSSMGGLISFNIALRRKKLFSKIAAMSPSLWWGSSSALDKLKTYNYSDLNAKIWFDTGEAEGDFMSFTEELIAELKNMKKMLGTDLFYYQVPDAGHSEAAWAARVHLPLLYFFGDIGELEDIKLFGSKNIKIDGRSRRINPVLNFDSFFKATALEGKFKTLNPDLLQVNKFGSLKAKKTGTAKIKFSFSGYQAYKEIKISR
ncbi:MAG: alpha/beta hydrolase [bacterium]